MLDAAEVVRLYGPWNRRTPALRGQILYRLFGPVVDYLGLPYRRHRRCKPHSVRYCCPCHTVHRR